MDASLCRCAAMTGALDQHWSPANAEEFTYIRILSQRLVKGDESVSNVAVPTLISAPGSSRSWELFLILVYFYWL